MENPIEVICIKGYKTLPEGEYKGQCVRKEGSDGSYNGSWTTKWEYCSWDECTSIEIANSMGVTRRYSKKNFTKN